MDGIDGLVGGCMIIIISYAAFKLNTPWIIWMIIGSIIGFLKWNWFPAKIFMGDVGSLSLGAVIGYVAMAARQEIVLIIMGGIFVAETISVIIQITSIKLFNRKVFLWTPLHHHFEKKGWPEPKVVSRFWIVTFILVLVGIATLKIR